MARWHFPDTITEAPVETPPSLADQIMHNMHMEDHSLKCPPVRALCVEIDPKGYALAMLAEEARQAERRRATLDPLSIIYRVRR